MPVSSEDAQMVKRVLRGDKDAFAELVRAHQGRVLAAARHLCGEEEAAQDLAQEALVEAYRSLGKLREPAAFGAWVYGITRNLCRRYLARRPPATASLERDPLPDPPAPVEEDRSEVLVALGGLPLEHREVLAARYLQELDYAEIGTLLGITPGNVRVRCFRARQALREALVCAPTREAGGGGNG
jgi:RNA polymerase sigma-70 factor (ECF subfamily)